MNRESLDSEGRNDYEPPRANWVCGDRASGNPCPLGPSGAGVCSRQYDCQPILIGDRWECARPRQFGGPCNDGPSPSGTCGHARRDCRPIPRLRRRRHVLTRMCLVFALGISLVALNPSWRHDVVAPGPLTTQHQQLANRESGSRRCVACHPTASEPPSQWLASFFFGPSDIKPAQSDQCLHCHGDELMGDALFAHSLAPDQLRSLALSNQSTGVRTRLTSLGHPRAAFTSAGEVACATCHREHQGANHQLAAISNTNCTMCHQSIRDFVVTHPEFNGWPNAESGAIAFSHTSHQFRHFPKEHQNFDCSTCHGGEHSEPIAQSVSYKHCQSCHDTTLRSGLEGGIAILSVPSVEWNAVGHAAKDVPSWPLHASHGFDGMLPDWMALLLLSDPDAAQTLNAAEVPFDFFDIEPDDTTQVESAAQLATAIYNLARDLADAPEDSFRQRLATALGQPLADNSVEILLSGLPTDFVTDTVNQWFRTHQTATTSTTEATPAAATAMPTDNVELLLEDTEDELGDDLLLEDSDLRRTPPPADVETQAVRRNPRNAWFRDDVTHQIAYRATSHGDPVLKELIDMSFGHYPNASPVAQRILANLRQSFIVKQCTSCHPPGHTGPQWKSPPKNNGTTFTVFRHEPHLMQPGFDHCDNCHRTVTGTEGDAGRDFHPVAKAMCATCHHSRAASDNCTTCHRYHVSGTSSERVYSAFRSEDVRQRRKLASEPRNNRH